MPAVHAPLPQDPATRRRGAIAGLTAAMLFGLSAPLAKLLLSVAVAPILLAGLFYLGAGLGLTLLRGASAPAPGEALAREDLPAMAGVILLGGILGPAFMMLGLSRVSAMAGSLLLNLEAPLTIVIAIAAFGERPTRRVVISAAIIVAGAAVLGLPQDGGFESDPIGIVYLALACLVWSLDTNLMRVLSRRDPFAVSRVKTSVAGAVNVTLGLVLGPTGELTRATVAASLAIGFVSYGLSTVLASMALRRIGASRHATFFATAPFFGAIAAMPLLGERPSAADTVAMAMMAFGVALLMHDRSRPVGPGGSAGADDAMVGSP